MLPALLVSVFAVAQPVGPVGLQRVAHDGTLAGSGTTASPLGTSLSVTSPVSGTGSAGSPLTSSGDISSVVAGNGLVGGATSGTATLDVACGTGLSCNANDITLSLAGGSCSAGRVVTAISSTGEASCTAIGTAGGVTGTGTANTIAKFSGTTAVGASLLTDDASTLNYNGGKFTVDASTGNTAVAGLFSAAGVTNSGKAVFAGVQTDSANGSANDFVINDGTTVLLYTGTAGNKTYTGFKCGASDCSTADNGRILIIVLAGETNVNIGLTRDSSASTDHNRIYATSGGSITINGAGLSAGANASVTLLYDAIAFRWRVIAKQTQTEGAMTLGSTTFSGANATITGGGILRDQGTPSSVASCGTGATITGGGFSGRVVVGTSATGCAITHTSTTNASCVVSSESGVVYSVSQTSTVITLTNGTQPVTGLLQNLSGTAVNFICPGH